MVIAAAEVVVGLAIIMTIFNTKTAADTTGQAEEAQPEPASDTAENSTQPGDVQ